MEKTIKIEGMMCQHCEKHVREALEVIPGVAVKRVDRNDGVAVVEAASDVTDKAIAEAIEEAGYKCL